MDVWLMVARGVNPYCVPLILHACDQVAPILLRQHDGQPDKLSSLGSASVLSIGMKTLVVLVVQWFQPPASPRHDWVCG